MPCYDPWDSWLEPGTPEHEAARKRVERNRDAFVHVVDAYLTMHRIRPPRGQPSKLAFVREAKLGLRDFDMRRFDGWMLHRIAQHCLCDEVTPMDLYDVASLWRADSDLPEAYSIMARNAGHAIRRGLVVGLFSRAKYEALLGTGDDSP